MIAALQGYLGKTDASLMIRVEQQCRRQINRTHQMGNKKLAWVLLLTPRCCSYFYTASRR
jgi:hypothetical protein